MGSFECASTVIGEKTICGPWRVSPMGRCCRLSVAGVKGYVGSARRNPRSLGAIRVKGHEGWRGHVTDFDENKTSDSSRRDIDKCQRFLLNKN